MLVNRYNVDGYISLHWLNILNKEITKVNGIEYLIKVLNISNDDVYVIGDGINDLTMINKYNGYIISDEKGKKNINSFSHFMDIIYKG